VLVELGPTGGDAGGRIVAAGTPRELAADKGSITGPWLFADEKVHAGPRSRASATTGAAARASATTSAGGRSSAPSVAAKDAAKKATRGKVVG
jgi:hypothetical protein